MCWQHSVCMGLLEDSIPDQYICYICRDPPGNNHAIKQHTKGQQDVIVLYSTIVTNYSYIVLYSAYYRCLMSVS